MDFIVTMDRLQAFTLKAKNQHLPSEEKLNDDEVCDVVQVLKATTDGKEFSNVLLIVTECFRGLRNACAGNEQVQTYLGKNSDFLNVVHVLLKEVKKIHEKGQTDDETSLCARCFLQMLFNFATMHSENQRYIGMNWNIYIFFFLKMPDIHLASSAAALLHCILQNGQNKLTIVNDASLPTVIQELIRLVSLDSEFSLYCIEVLLSSDSGLENSYFMLSESEKKSVTFHLSFHAERRAKRY